MNIANRTKGNFYQSIQKWNLLIRTRKLTKDEEDKFLSSINSYLGIMQPCKSSQQGKNYKTYNLRKKMLREGLSAYFWNTFNIGKNYQKLQRKKRILRKTCQVY